MATVEKTLDSTVRWTGGIALPPGWALVRRDLIGELRRRRAFIMLVLIVGACSAFVSLAWPSAHTRLQDAGNASRELFGLFEAINLIAASVLPPGLAALAFASERRQDTLDQLRLSLISTIGLVTAKLLSSVGLVALLFIGTLPTLGVQMMLVGVSTSQVLGLAVLVLTTAFMGAAIGLLCGVLYRRPTVALVMSYIGMVLAMGGWIYVLAIPFLVLLFFGTHSFEKVASVLHELLTFAVGEHMLRMIILVIQTLVADVLIGAYVAVGSGNPTVAVLVKAGGYRIAIGVVCIVLAARVLRRPAKPLRVPKEKPIDDPTVLWERRHRFPYYLIDPLQRRSLIDDKSNPVLVRELRYGIGVRLQVAFRIFGLATLIVGLLGFWLAWPSGAISMYGESLKAGMLCASVFTAFVVQILTANVMTKEREQGNLGLLRMTLLSPRDILVGKLGGAVATISPYLLALLVASVPVLILTALMGNGGFLAMTLGLATLLTCAWFTLCLALCVSVHTRSTAASLTVGVLLNTLVYGGPLLLYVLCYSYLEQLMGGHELAAPWESYIFRMSPLMAYGNLNVLSSNFYGYRQDLAPTSGLHAVLPVYVAMGIALLVLAYRRLSTHDERDE